MIQGEKSFTSPRHDQERRHESAQVVHFPAAILAARDLFTAVGIVCLGEAELLAAIRELERDSPGPDFQMHGAIDTSTEILAHHLAPLRFQVLVDCTAVALSDFERIGAVEDAGAAGKKQPQSGHFGPNTAQSPKEKRKAGICEHRRLLHGFVWGNGRIRQHQVKDPAGPNLRIECNYAHTRPQGVSA